MNPLINEAAASVELGWLLGGMTAVFLATFLFWFWYAYSPRHKKMLDEAARMPFDQGE